MMAPGPVLAELSCRDFLCVFITAVPCTKLFGVFKNTWNTFFLKKSLQPLAKTYFTKTLQSSADSSNNMAPSSSPPRRASPGARESRFCSSFRRVTMRAGHGLAARVRSASLAPVAIASRHLACRLQGFPACHSLARCAGDRGGASFCMAPACSCPGVPPGGGRSADEPASCALACRDAGVCAAPGESVSSRHIAAVPCPAMPLPLPSLRPW